MVQRDQIEVAGQALHPSDKLLRVLPGIVYAADHGVFKGNPAGSGLVIPAAGIDQLLAGIQLVYRHNGVPDAVVGGMEGHGKGQLQIPFCQLIDFGHQAAGGKADVPHGDVHSLGAVHQFQKAHHIVKVVQRLPNAHEHDVGDG